MNFCINEGAIALEGMTNIDDSNQLTMTRREVIKRTALLSGYALSATMIQGLLSGCEADASLDWTPDFFSPEQGLQIAEMAETILPKSQDIVGAKDVFVHQFIDKFVKECFKPVDQENFVAGLNALNERSISELKKSVADLSSEDRLTFLNLIDQEAKAELEQLETAEKEEAPSSEEKKGDDRPFFIQFKQLVIAGFFSSEEVGTKVLAYDPIPGEFIPCMPYEEVGKAWAI